MGRPAEALEPRLLVAEAPVAVPGVPHGLLVAMRPRQWVKNLFVLAGLVFAGKVSEPHAVLQALVAFLAFCAASSAAYLVNDVRDAASDRLHPLKRNRPIAAGAVAPSLALATSATLAAVSLGAASVLSWRVLVAAAGFLSLQAAYTLSLKKVVLLDVMAIATLFVIRAAAGAEAVHVPISPWLLLCAGLLALFLGFAKRRAELVSSPTRAVLADYPLPLVDQLLTVVAASSITTYGIYAFAARPSHWMMATIPFVIFGMMRYLLLVHQRGLTEEPDRLLIGDRHLLASVVGFAVAAILVLQLS
ncbi:MAG: decaprenyl-phosphate phosphoribosyltransferase [Thermoleophilia bacterium]